MGKNRRRRQEWMDSLVTYRNTKIPCLIFLSTATSSILLDGEAQGQCTGAEAEAAQKTVGIEPVWRHSYNGENLIYSMAKIKLLICDSSDL
jgi:hypothetical protein